MVSPSDILVITTDTPSGTEIIKHLKPVSSHIVAGTNLFSDFFGGVSDIFGGRSGTYQNQLISIYNEAIEKIKYEAFKIGANCVVGLRIDIDEISGKGKSMFMITAIGTAVVIKGEGRKESPDMIIGYIGRDQIDHLKNRKFIIERAKNKNLDFSNQMWDFVIQNTMVEVYPEIIRRLQLLKDNPTYDRTEEMIKKFHSNVETYLASLPVEKKENLIYDSLKEEGEFIQDFLKHFIKEYDLLNIEKCIELIKNDNIKVQKIGLNISRLDKPYYSQEDIHNYQNLIETIGSNFKERGKMESKTTMLSSKEKKIWICECGKSNNIEDNYCYKCSRDIFGFSSNEIKPPEVIEFIKGKISLIEELKAV